MAGPIWRFWDRPGLQRGIRTGVAAAVASVAVAAGAIDIRMHLDDNTSENPPWDPQGLLLQATADAAAAIWEDLLPASETYDIDIEWDDDIDGLGLWSPNPFDNGTIEINPNPGGAWFFDPTPLENAEFDFTKPGSTLFGNLTPSQQADWFNGNVPDLLEVGFRGTAISGSAAAGNRDLLSTVVHEIGHAIGINFELDGEFDIYPSHLGGQSGVTVEAGGDGHISPQTALMCEGCGAIGVRRLPSAVDVLVIAHDEDFTTADLQRKYFTMTEGPWNTGVNWIGGSVPDEGDDVFVRRPVLGGDPATARLTANGAAFSLLVSEGANVDTNNFKLDVGGKVTVTGAASDLFINPSGELEAGDVELADGGSLVMTGGLLDAARVEIAQTAELEGRGAGTKNVQVSGSLSNDGSIRATGGALLEFTSSAPRPWNLDGETGSGVVDASDGDISFLFGTLSEPFSGTMNVGAGHIVYFLFPWESDGDVNLSGSATATAVIRGNQATFNGGTLDADGRADIDATSTFRGNVQVRLADAETVLSVGEETLPITLENATFSGPGELVFLEDVTVTSASTATIDVAAFSWDGPAHDVNTTVGSRGLLRLRGGRVENHLANITIDGGTMDVDTTSPWLMAGRLRLTGGGKVEGTARLNAAGEVQAIGQDNGIASPVRFMADSRVSASGELELDGTTEFQGGSYSGAGVIRQNGTARVLANTSIGTNLGLHVAPGVVSPPLWLHEFDWDGVRENSMMNIAPGVTLTINAVQIDDAPAADGYDGTVSVSGGTLLVNTGPRIVVPTNPIPTPGTVVPVIIAPAPWRLDGTMNLAEGSDTPAVVASAFGSPMLIHGTVNATEGASSISIATLVAGGRVNVHSDTELTASGFTIAGGLIDVDGTLRLQGAALQAATNIQISGTVELAANTTIQGGNYSGNGSLVQRGNASIAATITLDVPADFPSEGTTTIAAGQELRLDGPANIHAGATIRGPGIVRNLGESSLTLADEADLEVSLVNEGGLHLGALGAAEASVMAFTQTRAGSLAVGISPNTGVSDRLDVAGPALLDGLLNVSRLNELSLPNSDTVYTILTGDSIAGTFANATGGTDRLLTDFGSFLVNYSSNSVTLSDFLTLLAGDYNGNSRVEQADLDLVLLNWGRSASQVPGGWVRGRVDQDELDAVLLNWGSAASITPSGASVPEPATAVIVICVGYSLLAVRPQGKRYHGGSA